MNFEELIVLLKLQKSVEIVLDEIDDLDNLLALRWKDNLKLRIIQRDMLKRCFV